MKHEQLSNSFIVDDAFLDTIMGTFSPIENYELKALILKLF